MIAGSESTGVHIEQEKFTVVVRMRCAVNASNELVQDIPLLEVLGRRNFRASCISLSQIWGQSS